MDLIARTITTQRGIWRLSWTTSALTTVGIFAFGVPPVALVLVMWSAMFITHLLTPWAKRRLSRN